MYAMNPPWEYRWARFGALRAAMAGPHDEHHEHAEDDEPADGAHEHHGRHGHHGPGRRHRRRGGSRPGPFGPGFGPPPFAPPPFGPRGFGGRRGRRTSRGDVRSAVLALVAEGPRHGYDIIQEIAARSGGAWRPSPGSIYPTVAQLEDEGLVRTEKVDGRRVVHLTEAGERYVEEHRAELDAVWESAGPDHAEDAVELWNQLGQLHAAAHQVLGTGTPAQIATATAALTEARKTIYRLLAE